MAAGKTTPPNTAAWLPAKHAHPFTIGPAPFPVPGPTDIVIRVHAVAINPADPIVQNLGIVLGEHQYPAILGVDVAGTIHSIGTQVASTFGFKVGDRITGCADADDQHRGFQDYCAVPASLASAIPDTLAFTDAVVLPLGLCTAATTLFQHSPGLALQYPTRNSTPNGKILVVWGGSSSVGACAVQLAVGAGYEVVTTASAHNRALCESLGATHVLDHQRPSIVDDILAILKSSGKAFAGVMSAIAAEGVIRTCAEIAHRVPASGKKHVATVLPGPQMPVPAGLPEDVETSYCASKVQNGPIGPAIWEAWMPEALANGSLKCLPPAHIVGKGWESVQEACDLMSKGVSGKKLVVEIV